MTDRLAADVAWRNLVVGTNIMTPDVRNRQFTKSGRYIVESSTGRGFDREPIYGVSVLDTTTGKIVSELGCLFWTPEEAAAFTTDQVEAL